MCQSLNDRVVDNLKFLFQNDFTIFGLKVADLHLLILPVSPDVSNVSGYRLRFCNKNENLFNDCLVSIYK